MAPPHPLRQPKLPFFRFGPAPTYATFIQSRGRRYQYEPADDITVLELARLMPLVLGIGIQHEDVDVEEYLERHGLTRHFKVV